MSDPLYPDALRPTATEIFALAALALLSFLVPQIIRPEDLGTANLILSLCFALIIGWGALAMAWADGFAVMTSLFWFRVASGVYFGLGTAFVVFTDSDVLAYVRGFYPFDMAEVAALNQLVILCTLVTLAAAGVIGPAAGNAGAFQDRHVPLGMGTIGAVFLTLGALAYYGFVLPVQLDLVEGPYSSLIGSLSRLRLVGLFLLMLRALQTGRGGVPILLLYAGIEGLFGLLAFTKATVLIILLMVLLPFVIVRPSLGRIAMVIAILSGTFLTLQSVMGDLRQTYAGLNAPSAETRLLALGQVVLSDGFSTEHKTAMASMARFSVVNAATLVMDQYDRGYASDWPKLIPAVVVPRAIWPEKPVITQIGVDIYALGTFGRQTSSASAGYFPEAYWAGGWSLALALSVFLGCVLGMTSGFALRVFHHGRWMQMLVVLLMMRIGFRVDGHFIADVFGALVFVGFFWGVSRVLEALGQAVAQRQGKGFAHAR